MPQAFAYLPLRRRLLLTGAGLLAGSLSGYALPPSQSEKSAPTLPLLQADLREQLAHFEASHGVAVGLSVRDGAGKVLFESRSRERFALTSTVKALLCAMVYDKGLEKEPHALGPADPAGHAPVLGKSAPAPLLTLQEACRAALSVSDNRAANFVFAHTGGPKTLTAWLRAKSDSCTRSDRTEAVLNDWAPGEWLDTTTPSNASLTWKRLDTTLTTKARGLWLANLSSMALPGPVASHLCTGWTVFARTGAGSGEKAATRALQAILVNAKSECFYLALHLVAPAGTSLPAREALLGEVFGHVVEMLEKREAA